MCHRESQYRLRLHYRFWCLPGMSGLPLRTVIPSVQIKMTSNPFYFPYCRLLLLLHFAKEYHDPVFTNFLFYLFILFIRFLRSRYWKGTNSLCFQVCGKEYKIVVSSTSQMDLNRTFTRVKDWTQNTGTGGGPPNKGNLRHVLKMNRDLLSINVWIVSNNNRVLGRRKQNINYRDLDP